MPFEFKRSVNVCDKCHKQNTEVGKITDYTDSHDGYNGLLCSECIKRREKPYTEICPKCKRLAYKHGGLTYYKDSDADDTKEFIVTENFDDSDFDEIYNEKPPTFSELICLECHTKKVAKVKKIRKIKLTIKNFAKDHWKFWITITISIVLGIIGLSRL